MNKGQWYLFYNIKPLITVFGSQIKLKKDPDFEGHLFKTRTDLSSLHTMSMLQSDNQGPLLIHLFVCLLI